MSFTATINRFSSQINLDIPASEYNNSNTLSDDDERMVEEFARKYFSCDQSNTDDNDEIIAKTHSEMIFRTHKSFKRPSRISMDYSKLRANRRSSQLYFRNSFLDINGKVQDKYITKRAILNKKGSDNNKLGKIIPLADLSEAESITEIDGNVLAQLFLSGYAKLATRVEYLNRINVFPIADGDTGANMKVCLKIPSRNLLLDPSASVLRVASNMAADVLLNGQGNSGTILSHFYVCLAEEIRDLENPACHESLSIETFAACLARVGEKMADAVPQPVEGTLLSVARDSCRGLANQTYSNLKELLDIWTTLAEIELRSTPENLVIDGVKVLEKAGVVDSGACGFCYIIEGMWQASIGALPEAFDPRLFQNEIKKEERDAFPHLVDDHDLCDSKYRFCTEAVVLLKDGVTKGDVMAAIDLQCYETNEADEAVVPCVTATSTPCPSGIGSIGDSLACVSAPSKEGGTMLKVHIHTDEPQRFFDTLLPFSRDPFLKKEKVDDMKVTRDTDDGSSPTDSIDNAKFNIIGLSAMCLPPRVKVENDKILHTFPMFVVPSDTNEPVDIRHPSDTDVLLALNKQRDPATAVKVTTATSTPMQMKVELLKALSGGKPVLCLIFNTDKKMSAFGRNVLSAIDLLEPHQKDLVEIFVHGWANDGPFLMEAIQCARQGKTIDEAIAVCDDLAQRTFGRIGFMNATMFRNMKALRPGIFPGGFDIPEGYQSISGTPAGIRTNGIPLADRGKLVLAPIGMGNSLEDAFAKAAKHIKSGLTPGQKIGNLLLPCVGRPDYGHRFLQSLREGGIEIVGTPHVYNEGMFGVVMSWGTLNLTYKIIEE